MAAPDDRRGFELAERGALIVPSPLVSRGRPVFDSEGPLGASPRAAPGASDAKGGYRVELRGDGEAWLAVHAGVGPGKLLVSWAAPRSGIGADSSPPASYRIETSASSTRGGDGAFRLELCVIHNTARARAHVIDFDGQSWVRISFEGACSSADAEPAIGLERLDLHDASDGTDDVWLILGDELARDGLTPAGAPGFAEHVNERYPGYYPALIDETQSGEQPAGTLLRIAALLEAHPHARHVALAYGPPSIDETPEGLAALATLVATLCEHGRAVVLARTPELGGESSHGALSFNRAVAALEARYPLIPGPDLRELLNAHAGQGSDGGRLSPEGRPTPEGRLTLDGRLAMQRLWLEALDPLYVPQ
jgi:hypothetical protein